jgi:uncharacterized SAM-binding protein YcdF (DUF218 family)
MKSEGSISPEKKEDFQYPYDAVVVLGANVKKVGDRYAPTDLRSPTEMGLAGGGMRIAASTELYLHHQAKRFVFSGGQSPRAVKKYGPDIPPEARIYGDQFERVLAGLQKRSDFAERFQQLETPEVGYEDRSQNTETNLREVLRLIHESKWQRVALLTSDYHVPRVRELYEQALRDHPEIQTEITFLSAEDIMKESQPGKYDDVIRKAYESEDGVLRQANEAKGLADLQSGRYRVKPFDIADRSDTETRREQREPSA